MQRRQPSAPAFGLIIVMALGGCASSRQDASEGLDWDAAVPMIERALDNPQHAHAVWGVDIVDLSSGTSLFRRNPGLNLIPASNAKLYTTAAALDLLGPGYVFETVVATSGSIQGDTLFGPIVIRGSGDPTIGGRFTDGDELAIFRQWAAELRAKGIRHIVGDIVGDDNAFDDTPLGYGWSWDDEPYWYSAELSALSFNDNCIDVTVDASAIGLPAAISWRPMQTSYVNIVNRTETVAHDSLAEETYRRKRAANEIVIQSKVALGTRDSESLSVSNPTTYFVHVLRDVLESEGIEVDGYAVDIDELDSTLQPVATTELIRHRSRPLADIVAVVNKRSQNLYADQLLKVLGGMRPAAEAEEPGGSAANGIAMASKVWVAAGIDTSLAQVVDGSGLSRYNLVSASMTTRLLSYMWSRPDSIRTAFYESLPIGGVDGTLAGRYDDGPARGMVHAKTGSVSNVSSLSGYVTLRDGTPIAFSLICNNFIVDTDEIRDVQDVIVGILASVRGV